MVWSTSIIWLRALPTKNYVFIYGVTCICILYLFNRYLKPYLRRSQYVTSTLNTLRRILPRNGKVVSVQLYYGQRSDLLYSMADKLKAKLTEPCSSENITLNFLDVANVEKLQNNTPVIVLCVNSSRLGTDVSGAVEGLPDLGNTAVVVLHHKQQHALSSVPSEKLLIGQEYRDLGRIIDMACWPDTGFYHCDMNTSGLEQLVKFIKPIT